MHNFKILNFVQYFLLNVLSFYLKTIIFIISIVCFGTTILELFVFCDLVDDTFNNYNHYTDYKPKKKSRREWGFPYFELYKNNSLILYNNFMFIYINIITVLQYYFKKLITFFYYYKHILFLRKCADIVLLLKMILFFYIINLHLMLNLFHIIFIHA